MPPRNSDRKECVHELVCKDGQDIFNDGDDGLTPWTWEVYCVKQENFRPGSYHACSVSRNINYYTYYSSDSDTASSSSDDSGSESRSTGPNEAQSARNAAESLG